MFVAWTFVLLTSVLASGDTVSEKCSQNSVDVIFLVDSSSSIKENSPPGTNSNNWDIMKEFIGDVVALLPLEGGRARAAVISFSTFANEDQIALSNDRGKIVRVINELSYYGGNTNTSGALRRARQVFQSSPAASSAPVEQVIVLITDGFANVDSALTLQEGRSNKQLGIVQYAVGVTDYANEEELKDLVSDPPSYHYLAASDFQHLNLIVNELLQRLTCNDPPILQPCKDTRADVVFILDASGSIIQGGMKNWIAMKNFFVEVANNLNVGQNETRISLIYFSHEAFVSFYLDSFYDKKNLTGNISELVIIGSQTNTSGALRTMNDIVFTPEHGDRPDIHNVAILMTDGQSNLAHNQTIPEAMRAKTLGVRMFVVGLTDSVNEDELMNISSKPIDLHYFKRLTYTLASTVVNNLVWNVCHGTCADSGVNCGSSDRCLINEKLIWTLIPKSLIIGHDYARLTDIQTPEVCQSICLQDPLCRSIEYIAKYQECSVSYYRKDDAIQSFRADSEVDYYEWICSSLK